MRNYNRIAAKKRRVKAEIKRKTALTKELERENKMEEIARMMGFKSNCHAKEVYERYLSVDEHRRTSNNVNS